MTSADAGLRSPFHSLALCAWLLVATLPSLLTSNPIHLGVALVLVGWTYRQVARRSRVAAAWGSFARLALFFVVFTLIFNVLMGGGGETVLVELPAWRVTGDAGETIFQVGGAVTLESLVLGLVRAAALLLVIYALATFNALADHAQLLRGLPRWLDQAATVVSIAIAFMPQLVAAQRDIREAQALRGHRIRGLGDALPLLLVLLDEALDRAMRLAESMEARGYSGPPMGLARERRSRWLIALGVLLVGVGTVADDLLRSETTEATAVAQALGQAWPTLAFVAGLLVLGAALYGIGRRGRRTRYRRELWRPRDTALTTMSILAAAVLVALWVHDRAAFVYPVLPRVTVPVVSVGVMLPLLGLLAPVALMPSARSPTEASA